MSQVQHRVISTTQCHKVTRPFPRCGGYWWVLCVKQLDSWNTPRVVADPWYIIPYWANFPQLGLFVLTRTQDQPGEIVWWPATIRGRFAKPEPKCGHRDWARNFFGKQDKYWWLFQIGPLNWYKSLAVHQTAICCEQTVSRRSSVKWK